MLEDKGRIGEDFVNKLAYNSFLKFWCYPGPRFENGDKKEICDLLIIFQFTAIIISVKNYEFKGNHFRYFNKTIEKAVKQIYGACRVLFGQSEVFIKHPDKVIEVFPKERIKKTFRIIVNLGEGIKFYPFNAITKNDDYVTLFDKNSFETIISELDTIPDFIDYLEKREELFKGKTTIILPGDEFDFPTETQEEFLKLGEIIENKLIFISGSEKDLLAHFFSNKHNFPEILNGDSDAYFLKIDGNWNKFVSHEKVLNKYEANRISYFVDDFVKNELLRNDLLKNLTPMREGLAKALLSFDRLTRRVIGKTYIEFYEENKNNSGLQFSRRFGDFDGVGLLLTFFTDDMDMQMINLLNQLAIESANLFSNYKSKSLILISSNQNHRFLFYYIEDLEKYSPDKERQIREDVVSLGWYTKQTEYHRTENEFPSE